MFKSNFVALSVLLLGAALIPACAPQSTTPGTPAQAIASENTAAPSAQAAGAATEIKEAGNTICPITGSKVGSMEKGAHVDYKGYRVGLCCNGCKEKFLASPDENLKKALEKK